MSEPASRRHFERLALPHLDAAYNLARWITRNEHNAEDVVQNAYLRAYRYFASFRGENFRAWLFAVVRRAAYDWLQRQRPLEAAVDTDSLAAEIAAPDDPELALLHKADVAMLNDMIAALPAPFREVIILRELHEFSYQDIAEITSVPIGTGMSRLARARGLLVADGKRRLARERNHG